MTELAAHVAAAELLTRRSVQNPFELYEALRTREGCYRSPFGLVMVTDYRVGRDVLRSRDFGVATDTDLDVRSPGWRRHPSLQQLQDSMFGTNGQAHTAMRQPFRSAFSASGVANLEPIIQAVVLSRLRRFTDTIASGESADFVREVAEPVAQDVVCEALGVPAHRRAEVAGCVSTWRLALEFTRTQAELERADVAVEKVLEMASELVRSAQQGAGSALMRDVVACPGELDDRLLAANVASLLAAGIETTATLLTNSVVHLLEQPSVLQGVASVSGGFEGVVQESLRLAPPLHSATRVAGTSVSIDGASFAAGDSVLVLLAACNRDPQVFEDPTRFDPSRTDAQHLAFGGGLHRCIGAHLASRTAVAVLRASLGWMVLGPTVRRSETCGVVLRSYSALELAVS